MRGQTRRRGRWLAGGLLEACCQKSGRRESAEKTGISEKLLLGWANRADLSRIRGVSTQYADRLECAGVDTVPELAQRNPENLRARMAALNEEHNLVRSCNMAPPEMISLLT